MRKMEPAEISAAKDLVMVELEDVVEEANENPGAEYDAIELAETIVEKLIEAGVLIPEWLSTLDGEPAQGYEPTLSQMEAWEGRKAASQVVDP